VAWLDSVGILSVHLSTVLVMNRSGRLNGTAAKSLPNFPWKLLNRPDPHHARAVRDSDSKDLMYVFSHAPFVKFAASGDRSIPTTSPCGKWRDRRGAI
jgi:hypothetical protein